MPSIKEMLQQVELLKGLDEEDLDRIEKITVRSMIGVTRETISRTFAQLKKEDLIETDDKNHLYINPNDLKDKI
ncbi:helix-turn-helix domain-containing protein [Tepidibacillus infernus]|uniref:HTH crp-type domain-containing protein n=1 Tax=Tepidibacillus decaturensis TaxID=1413211 RepID=A0A135L4N4_9BACI|nr:MULTISPECIES: helix-turn-helix domain-containing protein [Tepidibacillus]KXG43867.1 hypothetical protein U473_07500 [Tepidibacillus decaturensis]GBF11163.1 hypothetical protein HK1_01186 [Tepidibacillus sp. HK-1]